MTKERKLALRILYNAIDGMGYWQESEMYRDNEADTEKVNAEIDKIARQITDRYGLDRPL